MIALSCGHRPLPQERFRPGTDHWCPTCAAWVPAAGVDPDPVEVAEMVEEAAAFLRHPANTDAPLATDQGGRIGRCVCCGGWTDLATGAWCSRCEGEELDW